MLLRWMIGLTKGVIQMIILMSGFWFYAKAVTRKQMHNQVFSNFLQIENREELI